MNNENIKEILDELEDEDRYIEDYGYQYKRISLKDTKILLEYISNLQQELEIMVKDDERNQETIIRLTKENERLKENRDWWKDIVDEAIETLHTLNDSLPLDIILSEIEHIENILQNGSEEK